MQSARRKDTIRQAQEYDPPGTRIRSVGTKMQTASHKKRTARHKNTNRQAQEYDPPGTRTLEERISVKKAITYNMTPKRSLPPPSTFDVTCVQYDSPELITMLSEVEELKMNMV
ncbi:hypothetical protein JTB14_018566 [Gonioctena quinquepunctata]|nr:hypothetical protein JTB14_018566 [Gonioctena quinquepunctata]